VPVAGGVSPRTLAAGQAPVVNTDLLSAATTLQQSGGGAFTKLIDALQSLDQALNIVSLQTAASGQAADIATLQGQVTTLQGQVTTLQGQVTTLQGNITTINATLTSLQNQINTINTRLANAGIP
jgi:peptidoglycan hydrolase CwlO-like protein